MGTGVLSKLSIASSTAQESVKKLLFKQLDVDTVAAAGSSDTDAILLSAGKNMVTAADGAVGVKLPVAVEGMAVTIVNTVAGEDLLVYPNTSGQINALTATTGAFTVPGGAEMTFHCDAPLHWYVGAGTTSNIYDTTTGITAFATGGQASATALTSEYNNVTTVVTAGDSVKLPAAAAGKKVTVKNSGATSLAVFPADADSINALAINLSVNIPVGGELTFRAKDATVWETNEAFVSPAPTTQRGEFVFKASDNAADHEVIFTNASHGQATTITVPDGGAATSYVVQSTAAVTLAEADVLDTALAGTVVNSKAAIYDAAGKLYRSSATPAGAGTDVTNGTALTAEFNYVTGANGTVGVVLPVAAANEVVTVVNSVTTAGNYLNVYAITGSQINTLGSTVAFQLNPGQIATFIGRSATLWNTAAAADTISGLTATAAELNYNDIAALGTGAASKAVVLDAGEDFVWPATGILTYGVLKDSAATTLGATVAELNAAADLSAQAMTTGAGAGFTDGVGAIYKNAVVPKGTLKTATILLDLTGTQSSTTDLDVIGTGAGVAHIGRILAAEVGTVLTVSMTCLEAPATGVTDIDLYSATEGTGVFDSAIGDLTETAIITSGGAWTNGRVLGSTAVPAANDYLYLVCGAGGTVGTYTAGKILIEITGY